MLAHVVVVPSLIGAKRRPGRMNIPTNGVDPATDGDNIIRTIERWKRQSIRIGCLGLGCGPILIVAAAIGVLCWWFAK